ncbi:Nuclease A inhibitor-like protein OS=Anabaena variabilis (strain ATCC 29413 / PCC 7937) GN=Ava_B0337 PE=4 SV=1: NuiA [Gemmataceae bacterium]|nr:Nuclease A inhibitor-like protein OS=Anabaena variabilis (strain ATCC 29413 / PCC 7937) GN=Ava_B0337 PE=4 SV=1: NuiA [Gemmataceae bacterium]VTT98986.1 Nuclease A inhibitor-like protein OS=Anabaena variabilis (strain ATCC 29413 / PCC 7937) GN=Ava_B0337 PE=4 SV=1: NuiA [Gemmataceae bacterium]
MPTATEAALQQASAGLLYQSETDAPWEVVAWASATGTPSAPEVKRLGRHRAAGAEAEVQSLDEFFAPLTIDQDWYGDEEKAIAQKYRDLLAVITQHLTSPTVVKVGTRKVTVYVVGAAAEGGWAGIKTKAVET